MKYILRATVLSLAVGTVPVMAHHAAEGIRRDGDADHDHNRLARIQADRSGNLQIPALAAVVAKGEGIPAIAGIGQDMGVGDDRAWLATGLLVGVEGQGRHVIDPGPIGGAVLD